MKRITVPVILRAVLAAAVIAGAAQSGRAAAVSAVTVPAGTAVNVRLTEGIDVDLAQAGMTFRARVDDPVTVDGRIVIPREARAVVQAVRVAQSGQFKGSDRISLKLNSISFGGRVHEVATEYATVEGRSEGRRTARKVGGGAGTRNPPPVPPQFLGSDPALRGRQLPTSGPDYAFPTSSSLLPLGTWAVLPVAAS